MLTEKEVNIVSREDQISGDGFSSLVNSMKRSLKPFLILFFVLNLAVLICGCTEKSPGIGVSTHPDLTISVTDSSQMKTVIEIAKQYESETGVSVAVIPLSGEGGSLSSEKPPGDIVIANLSSIQDYAADGNLVLLNNMLQSSPTVNWTCFERPSLVMAGEYPEKSGRIYALPFYEDALGIVYKADLFRDQNESMVFCQTYRYQVGMPGTYTEMNDLIHFFSRNKSGLYGIGFAGINGPNSSSSPWMSILSSYGSGIVDRSSGYASGTWNSSDSISAFMMLKNLSDMQPPGAGSWGDGDVAEAFSTGKMAMAITWFSRFSKIQTAAVGENVSVAFMPLPGEVTGRGSYRGITARISGISLITGGNLEEAEKFLSWFFSPEVQMKQAEAGYQPSLIQVQDSYVYLSLNGYNRAFPESMRVGVSTERSARTVAVRQICEDAVRKILSPDTRSPQEVKEILDGSAASIDDELAPDKV